MGSRLYLPIRNRVTGLRTEPYPFPQNEKEELHNRLYATGTLLPGSHSMPIEELRDHVQAQEDKQAEGHYEKVAPSNAKPMDADKYRQVRGALREYVAWMVKRQQAAGLREKGTI